MSDSFTKTLLVVICLLLGYNTYAHVTEEARRNEQERKRVEIVTQIQKIAAEIESRRTAILSDCRDAMSDPDTKSIYHQIYHVQSAQLKMASLAVEQQQTLLATSARQ